MRISSLHIKKIFTLVLILCLAYSTLTVSAADPEKTYMWEITPNGDTTGENAVYLLGTVGVTEKNIYPLNEKIEAAYSQSDKLIIDVNPSDISNKQVTDAILKYGLLKQTSLDKIITAGTYNKADNLIKELTKNKKSLSNYKSFQPWVIENLILNLKLSTYGNYQQNGITSYFIDKAKKDKKETLSFETLTLQYRLLGAQSYSAQIFSFENTLDSLDSYPEIINDLFSAWENGDTVSMENLLSPRLANRNLLLERNMLAADSLKKFLGTGGKYFVIADASLMAGENSVLQLLGNMGYQINQM